MTKTNVNIPWRNTSLMQENRKVLAKMMHHFDKDHPVSRFLKEKCSHLLDQPLGDTGIPYSYFDKNSLALNPNVIGLKDTFNPSQFSQIPGVYYAYSPESEYCGSATDYRTRWGNHYQSVRGDSRSLAHVSMRTLGMSKFNWVNVKDTSDYILMFSASNPDFKRDAVVNDILKTFTQHEARVLEQSIILATEPNLNSKVVGFSTEWYPNAVTSGNSRPIEATMKTSGESRFYGSIREASRMTGIHTRAITKIVNYKDYVSFSPTLEDQLSFIDHTRDMKVGSPHTLSHKEIMIGIDYDSIPVGQIHAFNEDLEFVQEFSGGQVAGKACGVSKKTVLRNINKIFTNCTVAGVSVKLFFARSTKVPATRTLPTPVILKDILNDKAYYYNSIQEGMRALSMPESSRSSTLRKYYLEGGRIYHSQWGWVFASDWNGPMPDKGPETLVSGKSKSELT